MFWNSIVQRHHFIGALLYHSVTYPLLSTCHVPSIFLEDKDTTMNKTHK